MIHRAFPDYDPATLPAIPANWRDTSWHNDMCPSFAYGCVQVFIDYADPEMRESASGYRYGVGYWHEDDFVHVAETDDWNVVLAVVRGYTALTVEA